MIYVNHVLYVYHVGHVVSIRQSQEGLAHPWTASMNYACRKVMKLALILLSVALGTVTLTAQEPPRTVHVFVALADNVNQGIVPVPAKLGNGEDAEHNLYWGSAFGVKTFFSRSKEWELLAPAQSPKHEVLERCVFRHRTANVFVVADAYRGSQIKQAIVDFLDSASGSSTEQIAVKTGSRALTLDIRGGAKLVAYVGHDGLMDFQLPVFPRSKNAGSHQAIILACASKQYFTEALRASGAQPLLWTTNLMAPEAYTLKSALDGWILNEDPEQIRNRAATAYDKYQKCGIKGALRLFATGW